MASCSSACRTPTTVAHDAPQLSAPVSDRAPEVQRPETLQVPYSTVEAGVDEGALVSDALIRDLASEEEVTLGEALFRAGQTRAPGTEGLSAAYLAHERALAAEHALRLHRESGAAPEIGMAIDYIQQYHVTGISWHTILNHFGQDTAPCTASAPGFASATEPSLYSMD